jgi:hypothetical protein
MHRHLGQALVNNAISAPPADHDDVRNDLVKWQF